MNTKYDEAQIKYYELIRTVEEFIYDVASENSSLDEKGRYHLHVILGGEQVELYVEKGFITPWWVVRPSWAQDVTISTEDKFRIASQLHR